MPERQSLIQSPGGALVWYADDARCWFYTEQMGSVNSKKAKLLPQFEYCINMDILNLQKLNIKKIAQVPQLTKGQNCMVKEEKFAFILSVLFSFQFETHVGIAC